jgi:hypothetical protein
VGFEPTVTFQPRRFSSSTDSCPPASALSNFIHESARHSSYFALMYVRLVVKVVVKESRAHV